MLTSKLATRLQVSRGVLLKILGAVVLSDSQNPDPILDKKCATAVTIASVHLSLSKIQGKAQWGRG